MGLQVTISMATQRMTLVMESHDPLSGVWEQAQGAGYRDSVSEFRIGV